MSNINLGSYNNLVRIVNTENGYTNSGTDNFDESYRLVQLTDNSASTPEILLEMSTEKFPGQSIFVSMEEGSEGKLYRFNEQTGRLTTSLTGPDISRDDVNELMTYLTTEMGTNEYFAAGNVPNPTEAPIALDAGVTPINITNELMPSEPASPAAE